MEYESRNEAERKLKELQNIKKSCNFCPMIKKECIKNNCVCWNNGEVIEYKTYNGQGPVTVYSINEPECVSPIITGEIITYKG